MGSSSEIKPAVLLLDSYDEQSRMLHESFRSAGFAGSVIVLEDDAFLPEDVISIYEFFSETSRKGKARYFNEINVPEYWEIIGTGSGGKVQDLNHERGQIFYAEPKNKRLVKVVDWKNDRGIVRCCDHYNRQGLLCARTFFNKNAKKFCKAYFDEKGRETLVENYVTNDIILNCNGKTWFYKNKTELTLKVLEELKAQNYRIFYNSLSYPFFVSLRLKNPDNDNVLFWQEGPRNDIPGNMRMILEENTSGTGHIYVQNQESYDNLIRLGADPAKVHILGYAYTFKRENAHKNHALICTNSDNLEKITQLVEAMPKLHFHIAALTEMSSKLLDMGKYENVSLYPCVDEKMLNTLFNLSDYYLDINHESEIVGAVKRAFLSNQLVAGFRSTLHDQRYIAPEHIFADEQGMITFLKTMMDSRDDMYSHLEVQREFAMTETPEAYQTIMVL